MEIKKILQNVFLRIASWFETKKEEVPRKHKINVRKIMQPHIDKRVDMGSIPDPFGSCLSVLDNLTIAIEIITTRFPISDEKRRDIDQIHKRLNLSKRQFTIMLSDRFAEETYGKELSEEEELIAVYRIFEDLEETDSTWKRRKKDIHLEEWALNMRQEIDSTFKELVKITNEENIPVRPLLYKSLSPDVQIKRVVPPKNNPPRGDEGPGEDIPF